MCDGFLSETLKLMNDGDCGEDEAIVINSVREPPTSTPPHHDTTDANLGHPYMTG